MLTQQSQLFDDQLALFVAFNSCFYHINYNDQQRVLNTDTQCYYIKTQFRSVKRLLQYDIMILM